MIMYSSAAQMIHEYERDFAYFPAKIVDKYDFDQQKTLKRVNLYQNAQFEDGPSDEYGERVFFDISTPIVRNYAKNIDLDTKDINARAINGKDYFRSWIYRRAVRQWMRDHGIAKKLNEVPEKLSGIGTVVAKKISGPEIFKYVDLRNLACDPTAPSLNEGWASEKLYFLQNELRKKIKDGWDSTVIETAIADFLVNRSENYVGEIQTNDWTYAKAQYICVHEYYGYAPRYIVEPEYEGEGREDMILAHLVSILPEETTAKSGATNPENKNKGLDLYHKEISEMPYKEVHRRRVAGRWLGVGLWEELFNAQMLKNTQINWQLLIMRLSQLVIFQTRNKTPLANVLSQTQNGTVLKFGEGTGAPLERVDTQNRGLSDSNVLANEIQRLAASLGNSYEITTGENLPSNTPFRLGALQNQNANKEFDVVREDFGIFLQEIFEDWVAPVLEKDLEKGGVLELTDQDELEYIREHYVKSKAWDSVKKLLLMGKRPVQAEVKQLEDFLMQQLENKESMFIDWSEGFMDFKKKVEFIVTDERESTAMVESIMNILQALAQNPALAQTPAFLSVLDKVGLSIADVLPSVAPVAPSAPQPVAV